jgi:hypothetical protein
MRIIDPESMRHGLVSNAEDWEWSSACCFVGIAPVKRAMDPTC